MQLLQCYLIIILLLSLCGAGCTQQTSREQPSVWRNGFLLENTLIPVDQIFSGGPAKDGIPAIDKPQFIAADQVTFLDKDDVILGMEYQGLAKAYPVNILNWHEIVNDRFNDQAVLITFCPLCGSGMAFSAVIDHQVHTFGVSGLLYNSDVLLYDRQTESLWSQLMARAISGPHLGRHLVSLPLLQTTWQQWRKLHPETLVLSTATGFKRDYSNNPYADYIVSPQTMFPLTATSRRYHPKQAVLGLEINGQVRAYPFIELEKSPENFSELVGGQLITVRYDRKHQSAAVYDQHAKQLPAVTTYWFAWYAFHPQTEVYVVDKQ